MNRRSYIKSMTGACLAWPFAHLAHVAPSRATQLDAQGFEGEFPSMGTTMNLRWFATDAELANQVIAESRSISDRWVAVLSDYDPESEAMQVCRAADSGEWNTVSQELWDVIQACDQWYRWSDGAFDAALGALTRVRRQRKLATEKQWEEARERSGWHLLELDPANRAFRSKVTGLRLDFGAIGKGWVVDRIADRLDEMQIDQFVVNSSGNMRIGKARPGTGGWPISIDVPAANAELANLELCRLRLSECGVATSGDRWQQFPDSSDRTHRSSHIVDPKTLLGLPGHQSATIVAENAADADAAATASCVRSQRNRSDWLEVLEEVKPKLKGLIVTQKSVEGQRVLSHPLAMTSFGKWENI